MNIKDIETVDLLIEVERREIEENSVRLSGGVIDGEWAMIDYDFLELNSYTNDNGEIVVEVEELMLYNEVLYEAKYNHEEYEGFEEVYIYDNYGSAIANNMEDYVEATLRNSDKHKVTIGIFDALKGRCIKVVCGDKDYIIVKVD
jgi:hypothetical protein